MSKYDRSYDMPLSLLILDVLVHLDNRMRNNTMREPGVEPGCPKAPDPKSCATPGTAASRSHTRHVAPSNATPRHTDYDRSCDMASPSAVAPGTAAEAEGR